MPVMFTHGRVTVAAAVVALAAGAGITAAATGPRSSSHVASVATAGRTRAVLQVTSGTPGASPRQRSGFAVSVVLNSAVTWSLDLAAGTQRTDVNLRGGKVGMIAVTAGSDILDVSLPRPAGTLPFLFAGGASQFLLSVPGGVPVRVTARGGASFLDVEGQNLTGVAGGTVLATPGWAAATSRFDIEATAGVSRLTVSQW